MKNTALKAASIGIIALILVSISSFSGIYILSQYAYILLFADPLIIGLLYDRITIKRWNAASNILGFVLADIIVFSASWESFFGRFKEGIAMAVISYVTLFLIMAISSLIASYISERAYFKRIEMEKHALLIISELGFFVIAIIVVIFLWGYYATYSSHTELNSMTIIKSADLRNAMGGNWTLMGVNKTSTGIFSYSNGTALWVFEQFSNGNKSIFYSIYKYLPYNSKVAYTNANASYISIAKSLPFPQNGTSVNFRYTWSVNTRQYGLTSIVAVKGSYVILVNWVNSTVTLNQSKELISEQLSKLGYS